MDNPQTARIKLVRRWRHLKPGFVLEPTFGQAREMIRLGFAEPFPLPKHGKRRFMASSDAETQATGHHE